DVIVGFPGETDADFEETCNVIRAAGFSRIHVFSYSRREGTTAASLREAVAPAVVVARRERLHRIERELADAYCHHLRGRQLDVLVEGPDSERPGYARGPSCRYAPVRFPGYAPALIRRRVSVRAVGVVDGVILGEPEPEGEARRGALESFAPGLFVGHRLSLPLIA